MNGMRGMCPVHDYERQLCTDFCLPERVELGLIVNRLSHYWRDRARGVKVRRAVGARGNLRRETVPTLEPISPGSDVRGTR